MAVDMATIEKEDQREKWQGRRESVYVRISTNIENNGGKPPATNPNGRTEGSLSSPTPSTHGPLLMMADRQILEKVLKKKFVCQTPTPGGGGHEMAGRNNQHREMHSPADTDRQHSRS